MKETHIPDKSSIHTNSFKDKFFPFFTITDLQERSGDYLRSRLQRKEINVFYKTEFERKLHSEGWGSLGKNKSYIFSS